MLIFVNCNGKVLSLEVPPDISVAELKRRVLEMLHRPLQDLSKLKLIYSGGGLPKELRDNLTLNDYGVRKETTLTATLPPADKKDDEEYDDQIKPQLASLLRELAAVRERQVVFVGLGSWDSGKHAEGSDSVWQQQCPKQLFKYCWLAECKFTIILVDIEFKLSKSGQIYDLDQKWELRRGKIGEIRHYQYQGRDNFNLWVFPTQVKSSEWQGAEGTLAGLDVCSTFKGCMAEYQGCIIVGYFYAVFKNRPHCLCGDGRTVHNLMRLLTYEGAPHFWVPPIGKELSQLSWHEAVQRSHSPWATMLEGVSAAYTPSSGGTLSVLDVLIKIATDDEYTRYFNPAKGDEGFWAAFAEFMSRNTGSGFRYSLAPVDVIRMLKNLKPTQLYILHPKDWEEYYKFKASHPGFDYPR